jgi:hypothetical protein
MNGLLINMHRPFSAGDVITATNGDTRRVVSWAPGKHSVTVMDTRGRSLDIEWSAAVRGLMRTRLHNT